VAYNIWKDGQQRPLLPDDLTVFYRSVREVGFWPMEIYRVDIRASLDSLLRSLEAKAYASAQSGSQYELCAGTRELADPKVCEATETFRSILVTKHSGTSFESTVDRARFAALLIGPIQSGTIAVFSFAMLQILGLWLRYVVPGPTLYKEVAENGVVRFSKLEPDAKDLAVTQFSTSRVRSLGDSLYARVHTSAHGQEKLENGQKGTQSGDETSSNGVGTKETATATLESYRTYLEDDAASRQGLIEVLGDTMLKLAFLGTVFGISSALYSARGLDTADPLMKLVAKSEMYSGIGVGFGATLVGITLSITTGLARAGLARSWSRKISTAYRLILDGGMPARR
jgi:hypothetical protein